ncbi:LLM class flavin-dependent oxidoreductase [Paeniglutamicibacter sp. NPDC012692]|uniref:LLM class flavin-dependent oxidoreductase n=1 Tax=Paeniglutamicibacter sp. NPDC012692 TaxID=3364388 RepID=UPI0036C93160
MQKTIDVGVFIPVGKNGWIHSSNAPHTPGTFDHVLEVTRNAEEIGFDFVLSPAIWRGRKGPSEHWMVSLESLTTSAALLQATSRINVWATAHMTVYPPATIAKMITTLDQIGPGRVGLNLVTGASFLDLNHVGLWDGALDHDGRYRLGDEWIQVVKRLWSEPVVTHKGEFFETNEATMGPKPSKMPPIVNAGSSGRGFQFAAENCDVAFVVASDNPSHLAAAKKAKETARELGKPDLKTFGLVYLIPGETDEEAQALLEHFDAGVDRECVADVKAGYQQNPSNKAVGEKSKIFGDEEVSAVSSSVMVGSYEALAHRLASTVLEAELDGVMIIVPDYIHDLEPVATRILSRMAEHGVGCAIGEPSRV